MKRNILYLGANLDLSGYATASRGYIRALHKAGHNIETKSVSFDRFTYALSEEEQEIYNQKLPEYDVVIEHLTPEQYGRFLPTGVLQDGVPRIGYMAWETDSISWRHWVDKMNIMRAICVPCEDNIAALKASGVTVPIFKVPHLFDTTKYDKIYPPHVFRSIETNTVKFYSIFQLSHKKGLDLLLKSFFVAFKDRPFIDRAVLVLKTYINPYSADSDLKEIKDYIDKVKKDVRLSSYPRIVLLTNMMTSEEIYSLHQSCDIFVLPSRGEGWCIPVYDAMAFGKTPIATAWGGVCEYLDNSVGFPVRYEMQPCCGMPHEHLYTGHECWAEASISHLIETFRESYQMTADSSSVLKDMSKNGVERAKKFDHSCSNWDDVFDSILS
jgi:glycosyltransferase involved in cell wall biosynthesis